MSTQLQILKTKFVDNNEKTVSAVINYMKNNIGVPADLYSEIIVLLKLYLVSPATNAVSERPTSSMRRINPYSPNVTFLYPTENVRKTNVFCRFQGAQKCNIGRIWVKNWLRYTISQKRLNHCMLLSTHKEKTDEINLKNVANVFCEANEERRRTFGIFCNTDF